MAVKGAGTVKTTIDPPMQDRIMSNCARDGAAKKVQTSFPVKPGMRSRVGSALKNEPGAKGTGPDASSPNPLDPESPAKTFPKAAAAWDMKDANGQSVNHDLGMRVLNEGQLAVQYSGDKSRAANAAK